MSDKISVFKWVKLLLKDTSLKSNSKFIALYLSTYMNESNNIAWPSYARIQHETRLSKSTIAKYLKQLEKSQWIIITRQHVDIQTAGGLQASNRYRIRIPEKVYREEIQLDKGIPSDVSRYTDTKDKVYREKVQLDKGVPSNTAWCTDSEDKVYREMETNNKKIIINNKVQTIQEKTKNLNPLTRYDDFDDNVKF